MNARALEVLSSSGNKQIRIRFGDGEIMTATVFLISEEDEDVVVEFISSTDKEKYSKLGVHPALLVKFADIESVELVDPQ